MKIKNDIQFNFFVKSYIGSTCSPHSSTWIKMRKMVCIILKRKIKHFSIAYKSSFYYVNSCLFLHFFSLMLHLVPRPSLIRHLIIKVLKGWGCEYRVFHWGQGLCKGGMQNYIWNGKSTSNALTDNFDISILQKKLIMVV